MFVSRLPFAVAVTSIVSVGVITVKSEVPSKTPLSVELLGSAVPLMLPEYMRPSANITNAPEATPASGTPIEKTPGIWPAWLETWFATVGCRARQKDSSECANGVRAPRINRSATDGKALCAAEHQTHDLCEQDLHATDSRSRALRCQSETAVHWRGICHPRDENTSRDSNRGERVSKRGARVPRQLEGGPSSSLRFGMTRGARKPREWAAIVPSAFRGNNPRDQNCM